MAVIKFIRQAFIQLLQWIRRLHEPSPYIIY